MTSRELRNQRREQQRKARKLAYQQSRAAAASAQEVRGAGSLACEPGGTLRVRPALSEQHSSAFTPNPDLLDEFSADELAEMMAIRARVHARADREALGPFSAGLSDGPEAPVAPEIKSGPTGPRSPEGKATSSGNSLKHGLASGRIIIPGEDPAEFESLLSDLINEHAPANETASLLVQQMAQSWWLMQRAIRIQNQAFTETRVDTHKLALFLRYQTTHERAFYRALNSLIKLQKEQRKSSPEFVSHKRLRTHHPHEFVSRTSNPKPDSAPSREFQSAPNPFLHQEA